MPRVIDIQDDDAPLGVEFYVKSAAHGTRGMFAPGQPGQKTHGVVGVSNAP